VGGVGAPAEELPPVRAPVPADVLDPPAGGVEEQELADTPPERKPSW